MGDAGPLLPAVLPHHAAVRDRPGRGPGQLRDHPRGEGAFKGGRTALPCNPCRRPTCSASPASTATPPGPQAAQTLFGITSPFVAASRPCGGISYTNEDGEIVGSPKANCPARASLVQY